jgi:hypothetical protein
LLLGREWIGWGPSWRLEISAAVWGSDRCHSGERAQQTFQDRFFKEEPIEFAGGGVAGQSKG